MHQGPLQNVALPKMARSDCAPELPLLPGFPHFPGIRLKSRCLRRRVRFRWGGWAETARPSTWTKNPTKTGEETVEETVK